MQRRRSFVSGIVSVVFSKSVVVNVPFIGGVVNVPFIGGVSGVHITGVVLGVSIAGVVRGVLSNGISNNSNVVSTFKPTSMAALAHESGVNRGVVTFF